MKMEFEKNFYCELENGEILTLDLDKEDSQIVVSILSFGNSYVYLDLKKSKELKKHLHKLIKEMENK